MATQLHPSLATHPGEILREDVLPALGRPKTEIARLLKVSRQTLYDILNEEKPVTPQMALRLSRLLGTAPRFWLNLQDNHDLAKLGESMADELEAIPTLAAA